MSIIINNRIFIVQHKQYPSQNKQNKIKTIKNETIKIAILATMAIKAKINENRKDLIIDQAEIWYWETTHWSRYKLYN